MMYFSKLTNYALLLIATFCLVSIQSCTKEVPKELPNILWLTSEDNSPMLGCYGDEFATTPNLDKLASEGFLYTHAYANAPVCAPARNTILTGVYACSNGNQHMRSQYSLSDVVVPYPVYLREAGYYCTNNSKTDYNNNSVQPEEIWDELSKTAHYKNRPEGKPFFAVFNSTISHESCIHKSIPDENLRHNPEEVFLPPYHPSTPEMKHDWAQYYDKVEDMDSWVGEKLLELEEAGLAENTIVFYYGDHGGVLARSKRYVYETGTRVPFIVMIPEKYKYLFPAEKRNSKIDRLISFVDLVPTLLSIVGVEIPEYLQGDAFLGKQKTEAPEYAFMFRGRMDERYDMSRAVRSPKYRYIKNYMPFRVYAQPLEYLWRAPSIRSWEEAYKNGECDETQSIFWETKPNEELYDTENDPWEINNLAADSAYNEILVKMRAANTSWMAKIYDTGFIPEADLIGKTNETSAYDYMRAGIFPIGKATEAADIATSGSPEDLDKLISYLNSDESAIRYWGATGLLILRDNATDAKDPLLKALNDSSPNVTVAAEALYNLGEKEFARNAWLKVLDYPNEFARCHALNAIDCTNDQSEGIVAKTKEMVKNADPKNPRAYDTRAAKMLLKKWGFEMN